MVFETLVQTLLAEGHTVRFRARGQSMLPFIRNGECLHIDPISMPRKGDVVLYTKSDRRVVVHRVIAEIRDEWTGGVRFTIQGDNCSEPDGDIDSSKILGRVSLVERGSEHIQLDSLHWRFLGLGWQALFPLIRSSYVWFGRWKSWLWGSA